MCSFTVKSLKGKDEGMDIAFTAAETGTPFSDPGGMQG